MNKSKIFRENLSQILAITEKNIRLQLRFKLNLIFSFITPVISLFIPLIVMGKIFTFSEQFGSWNEQNFIVYQFIAYNIYLLRGIINKFPYDFRQEKFWYTLQSLIIAPFNRFYLLFGILFSYLTLTFVPFAIFFILCYIFYPISIITFFFVIIIYFLITLIFCGMGLILGIFAISKENLWSILTFGIVIIFWFSCVSYPFELFPNFIQDIINLNPLYYIIDILRLTWIEDNIITSINLHFFNFLILIGLAISFPIIGVYIFNLVYKKYGIVGY